MNKCGRGQSRTHVADKAVEYVFNNYTANDNVTGAEKRRRLGVVIAQAHERLAIYQVKNHEYIQYVERTQQDHPDNGRLAVNMKG
ncbi:hypothetical protein RQP46_006865 [Phenoliferia psychrophenolica]